MNTEARPSKFPYMEISTALGFIAMFCADLEWELDNVFGFLFRLRPDETLAIGGDLTANARVDLLNKAIETWTGSAETKKKLSSFVSTYEKLKNQRNKFIHGMWYPPKADGEHHLVINFKARGKVSATLEQCSPGYLYGIAQEIIDLQKLIREYFDATEELPNWKEISRNAPLWAAAYAALRQKQSEEAQKQNRNQGGKV